MNRHRFALLLLLLWPVFLRAESGSPLLLQKPALSQTHVAFAFADDLWIVGREGGDARRLTSGIGLETGPIFSPDGSQLAFTGEYEGNLDVYVIAAAGGVPRRLTYHPGADIAVGWTPDGKSVLFRSARHSYSRFNRLFTIPVEGGFPTELPLPMGEEGSFSPDGKQIAYVPFSNQPSRPDAHVAWKRYRGGRTSPIWIANLADSAIEKLPRDNSNDFNPMWVGKRIYFLSDRLGPVTLFVYDPDSKTVMPLVENKGLDLKSASACADAIVYEQFGSLHLLDLKNGKSPQRLLIHVHGDYPGVRPRFEKVTKNIHKAGLSPTGVRAVFEARGEILTVPAEKGNVRNLTKSPGVAERDPAWSPDGKWIAYFSDESGEYQLHLSPQSGRGEVKKFNLGDAPSFYYSPIWSPDSKKISYTDKRLNYWYIDLDNGVSKKIDTNTYHERLLGTPAWSPDGRWLAYSRQLKNYLHAVFLYSLETGRSHQVTDGMSDARSVVFDKNGKYLYFLASTDAGPGRGIGMSAINRPATRNVYVVVLNKDLPSPLAPESDEDKGIPASGAGKEKEKDKDKDKKEPVKVKIDLEDIDQRILALPLPAANYVGLLTGKAETLFVLEMPLATPVTETPAPDGPQGSKVLKFDLTKRKSEKLLEGVGSLTISADGEKFLYRQGERWFLTAAGQPAQPRSGSPGEGALKLDDLEVRVEPRAEWQQLYREVWRIERDFLYDPGFHGLDLKAAQKKYAVYLPGIASRRDLNYLFEEMLGNLSLGHVYIRGGDIPGVKGPKGGLLGADYRIENGRYRLARVYRGENWNPQLRAPLTQPGSRVQEGEYLLAVNGRELRAGDNLYSFFEGLAGKAVGLRVGPNADGKEARDVTVVPADDEQALRHLAWIDDNRRKVDRLTDGRVAYIYVPNTSVAGYTRFNRYFFAQAGKEAAIIDERFNGGGQLADHVIDYLRQPLRSFVTTREGQDMTFPQGAIFGPKVMLINEQAGSGGDAMPYYFRQSAVGPLIGKRTWGGLVGIGGYPPLIDGGMVTAPHLAIWFPTGKWEVENVGVAPDIEVEFDPAAVRAGHDPQLEKAVAVVLEALKKNPLAKPKRPDFPNYHKPAANP